MIFLLHAEIIVKMSVISLSTFYDFSKGYCHDKEIRTNVICIEKSHRRQMLSFSYTSTDARNRT